MDHSEINRLKTELAEAVGLLKEVGAYFGWVPVPSLVGNIANFLARHAKAAEVHGDSHTPAQAEQQEAQGAQAGDETQEYILRAMGLNYSDRHSWDKLDTAAVIKAADEIARLRAALATQPADDRAREMGYRNAINALDDLDRYKMAMSPATAAPEATQQQLNDLNNFFNSVCEGGLHSVEKAGIQSLTELGALENCGFGKHRLTRFGTYLLEQPAVRGAEQ